MFLLFLGARVVKRQAVLCKVPKVCQIWCRISGHSNGVCDETDDCLCSGESVEKHFCSDEHYNEDEQHTICAGFCQFKGKQTGTLISLNYKERGGKNGSWFYAIMKSPFMSLSKKIKAHIVL